MEYPISPRVVTRTARTPVLTNDGCPGLTEIKDVRIRNNLLEEIFNVEDSIELDYFELERQEANFESYLSGYNSPSNTRLSVDLKQEESGPCRGFGVESSSYQLHELQNRRYESKDYVGNVNQSKMSVTRPGTYEQSGRDLVAVASPTISSTCEGGVAGSAAATGVGNTTSDSSSAVSVSDSASVHSTTNAAGNESSLTASTEKKSVMDKTQHCNNQLPVIDEKPLHTVVAPVQEFGTRTNVRPRAASRCHSVNMSQQTASVKTECVSPAADISGETVVPLSSSGGATPGGGSTTASSSSTSPSQLHVTKRQRVIDCGSDLLAEVRQAYEYVQGADLYAPSFHPTFTKLDVAEIPATFRPNTDRNGQPPMNFNFAGQTCNIPVAFVGNSRVGDRSKGDILQPYVGSRSSRSPAVTYQSCPDLVSPGRPQVPEMVAYSRFVSQRPLDDEASAASLSAPTTPSKRAGPWSVNAQYSRGPSSPMQAQAQWRPAVSVPREQPVPVQQNRQHMMNIGQNVGVPRDKEQNGYENVYDPYAQQFPSLSRPQSPLTGPGCGRAIFHHADRSRNQYIQPPANVFRENTQMLAAGGCVPADAVIMAEGTPLSQNAFLRSVMDDESQVFRSHPLFPLLRDIIIADMNFHTPSFPFQLIANLPVDFNRLMQNYMQRNPHLASVTVSDRHTEAVVMDALGYAHAALIGQWSVTLLAHSDNSHQSSTVLCCRTLVFVFLIMGERLLYSCYY